MTVEYSTNKMDFCQSWIVLDLESNESLKCRVQTRTESKSDASVKGQLDSTRSERAKELAGKTNQQGSP